MRLPRAVRRIGRRIIQAMPVLRRHILSSTDYRLFSGLEEARAMAVGSHGWFAARTARRQQRAYAKLLSDMHRGKARIDLKVAAEAVAATGMAGPRVLEVGCGGGHYSEVFAALLPSAIRYTGIDYSEAMIALARAQYPSLDFQVADATCLPFGDGAFDIVFNGVSLMHILDYPAAVREAARVASHFCILHTVPVHDGRTTFLGKYAYGAPVVEVIFEKRELVALCEQAGLRLEREWPGIPYDVYEVMGHHSTTETYLFSKRA